MPLLTRAPAGRGCIAGVGYARVFVGEVQRFLGSWGGGFFGRPNGARAVGPSAPFFAEGSGADGEFLDLGASKNAKDGDVLGATGLC